MATFWAIALLLLLVVASIFFDVIQGFLRKRLSNSSADLDLDRAIDLSTIDSNSSASPTHQHKDCDSHGASSDSTNDCSSHGHSGDF